MSFALLIAGLLNDPPWKGFTKDRRVEFNAEPVRVTMSLWREGTFANPFATPTGYTAHVAPGLPLLQSLVLRFIGDKSGGWLGLRSLPALALSLQLALLPLLAWHLGYPTETGVLASLLGLLAEPGLEERWESHLQDLRHTAATKMAEAGVSESTMLALMGHMSRAMLERYSHIRMAAKREAVKALSLPSLKENEPISDGAAKIPLKWLRLATFSDL